MSGDLDVEDGMREARIALDLPVPASDFGAMLPVWPPAHHSLGLGYLKQDDVESALRHLQLATESHPDRPSLNRDLERAEQRLRSDSSG